MARAYIQRINTGGNFCGHDPSNPDFSLLKPINKEGKGFPRLLAICMDRLKDYYYRPRKVLPSLDLANGSKRKQRSERREACLCLLMALLKRTDIASLRVGIPTKDGFMNYTIDYIAKDTKMTLKRVERALKDLKSAGLVTVSQPRLLKSDGAWKGLAAVKAISKQLFGVFGLANMLKKERDKASKRQKEKMKKWGREGSGTRTSKARVALSMAKENKGVRQKKSSKCTGRKVEQAYNFDDQKQIALIVADLKQKNPTWSRERCYKEAEILLSNNI